MRAAELAGWLDAAGVTSAPVSVGAEAERAWCVRAVPGTDGGEEGIWEVFWCERGGRFEWTRFDDESAACFSLFGRLVWARLAGSG
ncbi:hypothetical protein Acsp06_56830 [Actinomycetospora sp. NBRC 106375]|uniref:hypothetical protein n=1 Tax=Actinomycetospora sp. NBRC 106375 TaxID=3032207 RepID=UPI0024A4BA67|nr:hypothetical protein [Actinomycetospora sp. NBRC 106375]GLZ49498.1 hypothetical protein Acsp06_56830 [Actinomycetospora sp. NBRC 106375]